MKIRPTLFASILSLVVIALLAATAVQAAPKTKTISGTIVDITCASKGHAMMDSWANAKADHMMEGGKKMEGCAAMCLKGGQPAGLFDGKDITAVFACNPGATLADYAGKEVEVQGFWGSKTTFVPAKIRSKGGDWEEVACTAMHK